MNTMAMNASELENVLRSAIKNSFNVLITGAPGIGKTDIIKSAVEKEKCDLIPEHAVTSEPTDYKGLGFPSKDKESARFLPYGVLLEMLNATKPLAVFFDDVGQAPQSVQAAIMQLILERKINGHKVSKHVRFLAATNRRQDNAAVSGLITPLISRFNSVIELEVDANAWVQWALANQMPVELIAFLRLKPALISTFDSSKRDLKNFACPRTIANLGKWINAGVHSSKVWAGCVGETFQTEFSAFWELFKTLGNMPDRICQGQAVDVPARPDLKFAICAALAFRASQVNWSNIMAFEFQTYLTVDSTARNPELMNTKEFIDFSVSNQNVL
jgi:hypothetical protein